MQFSGAVASSPRLARSAVAIFALLCLMMLSAAQAQHTVVRAEPAPLKAVFIVGPTDGLTGQNLTDAEALALVAESYGMDVRRVFHPNATWEAVMANVEGANLVVYMGHGNGWPSPYAPFQENTKDGIGINPYAGGSNSNTKYYGAAVIRESWHLAPNAIVFLNHLCYGAGNGEPGMAIPSWDIAHQRSDNFAAGFLAAGARTVFSYSWQLFNKTVKALFETNQTMEEMFMTPGNYPKAYYGWIGADARRLDSVRTPGTVNFLDRDPKDGFLRAVSGDLGMTAAQWRGDESSSWTAPVVSNVPTVPQNLDGTAYNNRVVKLTWSASTANHYAAVKYIVLRNGKAVAKGLTTRTYDDQPAKVGSFTYTVKAVDPAGVKSDSSASVTVTAVENAGSVVPTPSPTPTPTPTPTPSPTPTPTPSPSGSPAPTPSPTPVSPPSVPQNLAGTANANMQVSLTWSPSTASVVGTLRYRAFRNGTAIGSKSTSLGYTDQLAAAGTYKYEVRAIDAAGNLSAKSSPIWVSVTAAEDPPSVSTDTERPSNPDGLIAQPMSSRRVALSWNPSTDNSGGPITYKVFRGKKLIKTLSSTSFVDQPAYLRTFRYRVKAIDAAGNRSYFSPTVYVTTIA